VLCAWRGSAEAVTDFSQRIFLTRLTFDQRAGSRRQLAHAPFLCMLGLWMITFVAANRYGAKGVEALRARAADVTGPIVLGRRKFDYLDRTASLRMVSGCRARQFALLHIRMLITMGRRGGLAGPANVEEEQSSAGPLELIALEDRRGFPCRSRPIAKSGVSFEPFLMRHLRQPGDHPSERDRGPQSDPMPTLRRDPRDLGRAQGTRDA
jgi:hypothetical protein